MIDKGDTVRPAGVTFMFAAVSGRNFSKGRRQRHLLHDFPLQELMGVVERSWNMHCRKLVEGDGPRFKMKIQAQGFTGGGFEVLIE